MWTDKLRSTFPYSMQDYDNDTSLTGVTQRAEPEQVERQLCRSTCSTRRSRSSTSVRSTATAARELENGTDGNLNRLQLTTKYSF